MAIRDLRGFLAVLERRGELLHVEEELSPRFEIPQVLKELDRPGAPAVQFERVRGYEARIVGNLLGTTERLAALFEVEPGQVAGEYLRRREQGIPPKRVTDAPVKEVVHRDGVDLLAAIPVPTYHEKDGGPYVTCGVVVARDPASGQRSIGLHRLQVKGKTRTGIHLTNPPIAAFFREAEARGQPLEIAVALGADPIVLLASIVRSAIGDKLEVAGALRGEPIEVVPGETVSLEVPAGAEAILEGRILPHVREEEGPFGEVSQYYFSDVSHVVEITAITHRQQPVIQALHPTAREVSVLAGIPAEFEILRLLRAQGFAVEAVRISGGTSYPHAVFSIRQTKAGQARQALSVLLSSMGFIKHAVAVDEDVDLDDPRDVEWALATRVQADEDLVVVSGLVGSSVDPSAEARGVTAKVGVDATKPFRERERFERVGVPAEVRERARALAARYLDR